MLKKIKNLLFIIMFGLVLVFSGCSTDTEDANKEGLFGGGSAQRTSTSSGVSLEFAEGNPPSEMYKDEPRTFAFIFKNYQEHKIEDLKIRSKGYDKGFVNGLSAFESTTGNSVSTISAAENSQPGVFDGLYAQQVRVERFTNTFPFNPTFDYCYTAETAFLEQICVPSKTNMCDTNIEKFSKQNGPLVVSISSVRSLESGIIIDFAIKDSNIGKTVTQCFDDDSFANDYTLVSADLGTDRGNCKPIGSEKFAVTSGTSSFRCEFNRAMDDSYQSQVSVKLEYKYQQSITKQIKVIDLNSN